MFFITSRTWSCLIQDGLVDDEVVKQFQDGTFLGLVDRNLIFHALNARLSCQRLGNQIPSFLLVGIFAELRLREQTPIFSETV